MAISIANTFLKILAFVRRDLKTDLTYRLAFSGQVFSVFFQLALLYFIAKTFRGALVSYLKPYNGDYFSFVLIGLAFSGYVSVGLHSLTRTIREAQMQGTLEALLSTPTGMSLVIFGSSLWPFLWTTLQVALYLVAGMVLFRTGLTMVSPLGVLLTLALTISSHAAIGILSASVILVYKRGGPIERMVSLGSLLLGGVYYPVEALPVWLKWASNALPLTYALSGMRKSLLLGTPLSGISREIYALSIFSALLVPTAILIFRKAVYKAKVDGTLMHY